MEKKGKLRMMFDDDGEQTGGAVSDRELDELNSFLDTLHGTASSSVGGRRRRTYRRKPRRREAKTRRV